MAEKVRKQFGVSFRRLLILFMRNPLSWLITSQSPHHHIPSHWILEFNIQILEEYRFSVHTNRQFHSSRLTHRSWSTFVGGGSNDSLIFRASPGYIWCNYSLTGPCCCCLWWWKLILKCGLLSILVGEDSTSVSSQDGIEIPLLMLPRCFSVSGQRKISGPWDGRLPEPQFLLFWGPFLVLSAYLSVGKRSLGLWVQGEFLGWAICYTRSLFLSCFSVLLNFLCQVSTLI